MSSVGRAWGIEFRALGRFGAKGLRVEGFRGLAVLGLLEGSWVVISGVISPLI